MEITDISIVQAERGEVVMVNSVFQFLPSQSILLGHLFVMALPTRLEMVSVTSLNSYLPP